MSVAVSVAVGSAAQIGIFVVPLLVLISYFISSADGTDPMTFAFSKFSSGALLLAVLLAGYLLQAQRSHWLGGAFLICLSVEVHFFLSCPQARACVSQAHLPRSKNQSLITNLVHPSPVNV